MDKKIIDFSDLKSQNTVVNKVFELVDSTLKNIFLEPNEKVLYAKYKTISTEINNGWLSYEQIDKYLTTINLFLDKITNDLVEEDKQEQVIRIMITTLLIDIYKDKYLNLPDKIKEVITLIFRYSGASATKYKMFGDILLDPAVIERLVESDKDTNTLAHYAETIICDTNFYNIRDSILDESIDYLEEMLAEEKKPCKKGIIGDDEYNIELIYKILKENMDCFNSFQEGIFCSKRYKELLKIKTFEGKSEKELSEFYKKIKIIDDLDIGLINKLYLMIEQITLFYNTFKKDNILYIDFEKKRTK